MYSPSFKEKTDDFEKYSKNYKRGKKNIFLKTLVITYQSVSSLVISTAVRARKPVIDSFYYFGSSVIALFLSVLTTPIFSKHFSYIDFAVFNYFNNVSGFFSFFLSFEFMSFYAAEFYRNDAEKNKELIGSIIIFLLGWNLVFIIVIWQIATFTFSRMGLQFPSHPFLLLALITVGSSIFKGFWLLQYRLKGASFKYFIISASAKVLSILTGLCLVVYLTNANAAKSRMTGIMIVELSVAIIAIIYFFRQGHFRLNLERIKEGFRFCIPVVMGSVIYYLIISSDQFFLERKAGVKEMALYSLGLNFSSYLYFFNYSIFQAMEPKIIQYTIQARYSKLRKAAASLLLVALTSTVFFTFVSRYMISFLTKDKYTEAYQFANILAFANLFVIAFAVVSTIFVALKKTRMLFCVNIIGGIFSLLLFYISSTHWGVKAVAFSKIAIFVFASGIGLLLIKRALSKPGMPNNQTGS